jgi:poly(beta-D-mannuronate) lyase
MRNHLIPVLLLAIPASAQHVTSPRASFLDVPARQAYLQATTNPLLRDAIKHLPSCVNTSPIPAPTGRIDIPHHYLNGSHGPTNPAEHAATRVYEDFEKRITAGMNRYVATASQPEAACALAQLDAWAKGGALLNYDPKESSQAWYQVEWTLSSAAVTDSVLVTDTTLDAAQQARVTAWLDASAHKLIGFQKSGEYGNNHYYWRALAATAVGVLASDDALFHFGVDTFKEAISEIDSAGAFPREMERHERSSHYQAFALQPLIVLAEFASRQNIDLYSYTSHGRTLRNAIIFCGQAVDNPSLIKPYTSDAQEGNFGGSDYAPFAFFVARFGPDGIPSAILKGLQRPTESTRIGGNTTILATK